LNHVKTVCDCALLFALGLHTQWHVLYHKWCSVWSSWWNTQSYAASCCTGDTQLASVNTYCDLCTACSCFIGRQQILIHLLQLSLHSLTQLYILRGTVNECLLCC